MDEINEIETVAKAFLIAERMIKITIASENIYKEKINEPAKKEKLINKIILMHNSQNLKVRGLN